MENQILAQEDKSQNKTSVIYTALSNFKKHFKRNPVSITMSPETRDQFSLEIADLDPQAFAENQILFQGNRVDVILSDDISPKQSFEIR